MHSISRPPEPRRAYCRSFKSQGRKAVKTPKQGTNWRKERASVQGFRAYFGPFPEFGYLLLNQMGTSEKNDNRNISVNVLTVETQQDGAHLFRLLPVTGVRTGAGSKSYA